MFKQIKCVAVYDSSFGRGVEGVHTFIYSTESALFNLVLYADGVREIHSTESSLLNIVLHADDVREVHLYGSIRHKEFITFIQLKSS